MIGHLTFIRSVHHRSGPLRLIVWEAALGHTHRNHHKRAISRPGLRRPVVGSIKRLRPALAPGRPGLGGAGCRGAPLANDASCRREETSTGRGEISRRPRRAPRRERRLGGCAVSGGGRRRIRSGPASSACLAAVRLSVVDRRGVAPATGCSGWCWSALL